MAKAYSRAVLALLRGGRLACWTHPHYRTQGDRLYMYWQPVIRCKNPDCPTPSAARIRLPYADPPASSSAQPNWPSQGWQARIICRECDHWYIYQKADVEW